MAWMSARWLSTSSSSPLSPTLVRAWTMRTLKAVPRDEATQRYEDEVRDYNCKFVAEMHNLTTATQRKHAVEKIQGWRQDLMSLAGVSNFTQNGSGR